MSEEKHQETHDHDGQQQPREVETKVETADVKVEIEHSQPASHDEHHEAVGEGAATKD